MAFVVVSCDRPTSTSEPEQQLLNIPEYGSSALPINVYKAGRPTIQSREDAPPAYELLTQYAERNPKNPFIGIAGIWNEKKGKYHYKSIPLTFPETIREKSNGKTKYYWYRLSEKDSGIIRTLAALVPAVPEARDMMTQWLKVEDHNTEKGNNETSGYTGERVKNIKANTDRDNIDRTSTYHCWKWYPETGYIWSVCEDAVVTGEDPNKFDEDDGGSGSGVEWPSDDDDTGGCPSGCGNSGDGQGGNNNTDDTSAADEFENRIITENLSPCLQDEYTGILVLTKGAGEIISGFAVDELNPGALGNLNWTLEEGDLDANSDGSVQYGFTYRYDQDTHTAYTKFDPYNFRDASQLGVAQVMLHEAVHAYLAAYFYESNSEYFNEYPEAFDIYINSQDMNEAQHEQMARNFVNNMATALQQFGWNHNII